MKDSKFDRLLDECIDRMNNGESLEDCLASYPEHAEELRPFLEASYGLRGALEPLPRAQAKAASRRRLQQALNERRQRRSWFRRTFARTQPVYARPVALAAVTTSAVSSRRMALATVSVVLLVAVVAAGLYSLMAGGQAIKPLSGINQAGGEIAAFDTEEELVAYLQESGELYGSGGLWGVWGSRGSGVFGQELDVVIAPSANEGGAIPPGSKAEADRVSGTNVQVIGIDEPDIVKTDGVSIFFSRSDHWFYEGVIRSSEAGEEIWPPVEDRSGISIIGAYPPLNLSVTGEIDGYGDLLLYGDTLMVFEWDVIRAYDVSDPQNPASKWQIDIEDDTYTVAARLYQGKVYLVTQTYIDTYDPCPIVPLKVDGVSVEIGCTDIYCPVVPVPADATYNTMVIDAATGSVEKSLSFVGEAYTSVVYMSPNAIYVTYYYQESIVPSAFDFCINYCQGILPETVIGKIQTLQGYDISDVAKLTEIQVIIGDYLNSLSGDDRTYVENELVNRVEQYYEEHMRDLERTGIVKVDVTSLAVTATGSVPGGVLNQFSLDEHDGYLRMATTVGGMWGGTFMGMWWVGSDSANDVYVLDASLNVVGAVQGLGLTESIYAVRFIGDEGYVVTFRQVDPFYVLDLSNPQAPQLKGELKIPGYSSYLHPVTEDIILGIGEEDWNVKLSLFDVTSPESPIEVDKYTMAEHWSDVSSTHHAFLLDDRHEVFFLPAGDGGYVFSYAGNRLELVKAVDDIMARRAVYIDDYLYIVGDNSVVVYDEVSWELVEELDL